MSPPRTSERVGGPGTATDPENLGPLQTIASRPDGSATDVAVDLAATQASALDLLERGAFVFDVDHPALPECVGRHAADKPCDGKRGKHPIPWSWPRGSTDVAATVARVFGRGPRNIGVDCGRSGLVVLDEDATEAMDRACAELRVRLPATFTVSTGKGRHFYLRQPECLPFGNGEGLLRSHDINVRGRGGYVVGPGSQHASGRVYTVTDDSPIADAPEWLARIILAPAAASVPRPRARTGRSNRAAVTGVLRVALRAREGGRNNAFHWTACRLFERVRDGLLEVEAVEAMLADTAGAIGLPPGEAEATVGSARRAVLG